MALSRGTAGGGIRTGAHCLPVLDAPAFDVETYKHTRGRNVHPLELKHTTGLCDRTHTSLETQWAAFSPVPTNLYIPCTWKNLPLGTLWWDVAKIPCCIKMLIPARQLGCSLNLRFFSQEISISGSVLLSLSMLVAVFPGNPHR